MPRSCAGSERFGSYISSGELQWHSFFFLVLASKMSTFASFQSCAHSYFKLKLGFLSGQKFSCSSPLEGISQARAAGDTGQSKCKEPCARPTVKQMGATPVKPPLPCKSVLHVTKLKQRSTSSTWLQ